MFTEIRQKIKEVLEAQKDKIHIVYLTDRTRFEGFPAVVISPSENENDYGSTCNDRYTFVFKLRAYYPIKDETQQEVGELALQSVVDELLVIFRQKKILDGVADWVEPAPSVWQYEERDGNVYRSAEITLKCVKFI